MKKLINKCFMYIPLILVEVYLVATLLLYQFGPLEWQTENQGMFWAFLFLYHAAFIAGYIFSVKKIPLPRAKWSAADLSPRTYRVLLWCVLAACAVCACIEYKNVTHASSYIPYELPGNFINGLLNPAEQYYNKFAPEGYTSNKLVTIVSALFSFLYVSIIPLLVVEWKRITVPQKAVSFGLIFFKVAVYVSVGTNKGIFDTMFNLVGILLILFLLNMFQQTDRHIDKKTFAKIAVFALFMVVFSFTYFTANISSRVSSPVEYAMNVAGQNTSSAEETVTESETPGETPSSSAAGGTEESAPEDSKPTPAPTPTPAPQTAPKKPDGFLKRMYYSVTNYLTQGYYGFSLALDEDFTTTYGIGSSQFLSSNFKSIFGIDVSERTYQHKITELWDESGHWHSFYSYVANDVSFYGVVLVMLALGLFYGCICKDVLTNDSLIGKMLLPLFIIMFMYMPANNQVFTAMATCMAFFELSFLWIISKIRWRIGAGDGK